jgi:hypothetical protein
MLGGAKFRTSDISDCNPELLVGAVRSWTVNGHRSNRGSSFDISDYR